MASTLPEDGPSQGRTVARTVGRSRGRTVARTVGPRPRAVAVVVATVLTALAGRRAALSMREKVLLVGEAVFVPWGLHWGLLLP